MRIGFISDIHVDLNKVEGRDNIVSLLTQEFHRQSLDMLVIAGDISNDYMLTIETIDQLSVECGGKVAFVPGNHDLWNEKYPHLNAWDTYNALLDHPANLAKHPVFLPNNWAIIGDIGWYDFKFGDASFSANDFRKMQYGDRTWQDSIKAPWGMDSIEMHTFFKERISSSLSSVKGHNIVLVTHAVQIAEFTVRPPNEMWKYFNAFLGSPEYGELAIDNGAVLSVCGHVHYRRRARIGCTEFICPCLGYSEEWFSVLDPSHEVAQALQCYELAADGSACRIEEKSIS